MSTDLAGLGRYLVGLTTYVEGWGVSLVRLPVLDRDRDGVVGFEVEGELPARGPGRGAGLILRERWSRGNGTWDRNGYEYELVDHELGRRRALHHHDPEAFIRSFRVVVHEHCAQTLGLPDCTHYAGPPVVDGYDAARRLLAIWADPAGISCAELECLEA